MAKRPAEPEPVSPSSQPRPEGMFRSSDDVRCSFISGIEAFTVKPVEYNVINGMAIFEGDIAARDGGGDGSHPWAGRGARTENDHCQ